MDYKITYKHLGPVDVDERFFDHLDMLVAEAATLARTLTIGKYGFDFEGAHAVLGDLSDSVSDNDRQMAARALHILQDIKAQYSVELESHTSIETDDLADLRSTLVTEPAQATRISVVAGHYASVRLNLNIDGGAFQYAKVSVDGHDRAIVRDLTEQAKRLLINSESYNPLLRSVWARRIVGTVSFVALLSVMTYALRNQLASLPAEVLPFIMGALALVAASGCWSLVDSFRSIFRPIEFHFGVKHRRRGAKLFFFGWLTTTIILPILFFIADRYLSAPN